MAVRFDLDPDVRDSFDFVTKELDAILAVLPGSGEKSRMLALRVLWRMNPGKILPLLVPNGTGK